MVLGSTPNIANTILIPKLVPHEWAVGLTVDSIRHTVKLSTNMELLLFLT